MKQELLQYKMKVKIGDIIYPIHNGTLPWYKKSQWFVVTKLMKDKTYKNATCFNCFEAAIIYSELIRLKEKIKENKK